MKNLITICVVVAAMALFAGSVQADCHGHGGYGGYHQPYMSHGFVQPHLHFHDTSHFDYHPTQYIPHGNHLHVIPGHYDFHQTGHYDLHW